MIEHKFICDSCSAFLFDTNTKAVHKCPNCDSDMRWDLSGIGMAEGDYEHISDSLAVNVDQIAEHRAMFPDVEVLSDGRPKFKSYKQHDEYLKKTGFVKVPQKIRPKAKKIKSL